jgi:putative ABC transport system permease protein
VVEGAVTSELGPILRSIGRRKTTFALVVLELASGFTIISTLLLTSAWYIHKGDVNSGYPEDQLVAVSLHRAAPGDDAAAARVALAERLSAETGRLQALPGVAAVVAVSGHMLDELWGFPTSFRPGVNPGVGQGSLYGWSVAASGAVGAALDLRVRAGALPAAGDPAAAGAAVITRCLREGLFPGGRPAVGQTIVSQDGRPVRVAAVIEDVFGRMPFMHNPSCLAFRFDGAFDEREAYYLVRAQPGQREAVLAALPQLFGPSGPGQLVQVKRFDSSRGIHTQLIEALFVIFAIMGVTVGLLALLGAAAVASFLVAERTRQIGIRRAIGAARRDVIRYFLVENAVASLLGTGLGLMMTAALYVVMQRVFIGIQFNVRFLGLTALLLWLVATLAAMIPARRAAEIPPSIASRV